MNLAFTYNVKNTVPSKNLSAQSEAEFDAPETIESIKKALESGGHSVIPIEADEGAYSKFHALKDTVGMVFTIAEGLRGHGREAQIPAMLEMLGIPYTHSDVVVQAITLDKALTKKILRADGVNTPQFQLISSSDETVNPALRFPLIVKPNSEGSSKGIFNENLVYDKVKLQERIKWLIHKFHQPVLVEEFLSGREFTVALLGNPPKVLPIVEQNYSIFPENMPHFASYEAKWLFEDSLPDPHQAYFCPPEITKNLEEKIQKICLETWDSLGIQDVCRIDLRLDSNGNPSILEVNTIPGMMPDPNVISYFPIAARKAGYSFDGMVNAVLDAALQRYGIKQTKTVHTIQKPLALSKSK